MPKQESRGPKAAIGINLGQILLGGLASAVAPNSAFIPVPLESAVRLHRFVGLAFTLQYLHHHDGEYMKRNEAAIAFGPRISFAGRGLKGGYASVEVGMSMSSGKDLDNEDYLDAAVVLQPKIGYMLLFKRAPLYLNFGMGLFAHFIFHEDPGPLRNPNALGKLALFYTPVLNISFGFLVNGR